MNIPTSNISELQQNIWYSSPWYWPQVADEAIWQSKKEREAKHFMH
jgi:hypothetical protein